MRSHVLSTLAIASLTATASAGIEVGDTLSMTFLSVQPSRVVTASLDGGLTSQNIYGGVLNWSVAGHGTVKTFCTQIEETVSVGTTLTYSVVDLEQVPDAPPAPGPMGADRAILVRDLYARYYDSVMTLTGNDQKNQAGAFAMVLWEITHQDSSATSATGVLADLDLTAGNAQFSSSSTVNTIANAMLAALGGGTGDFLGFNVVGATNPDNQDVLIVVPGPAGLAALAGLAAARRRRRR